MNVETESMVNFIIFIFYMCTLCQLCYVQIAHLFQKNKINFFCTNTEEFNKCDMVSVWHNE